MVPEPHIVELPVKGRMTVKLPTILELRRQEWARQDRIKLLPERAASRYEASKNKKRGRFGLPWWIWRQHELCV